MSKTSHLLSKQNSQQPKQFRGGEKKVMKKSLSLLVAIAMVFSMFATLVSAAEKSAGETLKDLGVINGTSNGLDEDKDWKRQDITVLLARLLQVEETAKAHANTHGFTDVDSKYYNGFISWAKENGYFNGKTETVFGVGESITNQQFAAVLLRVLKVDVPYTEAFDKAVELKLVSADLDAKGNAVRGEIYTALLGALDYKIDGVKLGTILGLKGYQITELDIVKASAVIKSSVILEFNTDVDSIKSEDVTVEDANGNVVLVEKATVNGAKVNVALSDELESGKTYTVNVASATSKEGFVLDGASAQFKYSATEPATIDFAATTIALDANSDSELKVIVKDVDGNDITANYSASDFTVQSSDASVIDGFDAKTTGDVIVNVKLAINDDESIETGNQIITVKTALSASITDISFVKAGSSTTASDNDVKVSAGEIGSVEFTAEDQAKVNYDFPSADFGADDVTFKSLNPSRLVVDSKDGSYEAIQEGSATVQITANVGGVKVTKSVIVTVQAKSALSAITVSESSVKIVEDSSLPYTFTVKTTDQFGDKIVDADATLTAVASNDSVVTVSNDGAIATGESVVTVTGLKNGSTTVKVTVKSGSKTFTKNVSVSQVAQNGFGGYVAEVNNATIDVTPNAPKADKDAKGTAQVSVFEKDKNGNKYAAASGVTFNSKNEDIATVDASGNVTPLKAGTATIEVISGTAVVATVKVTVVKSSSVISKVTQAKSTITVSKNASSIESELFGKSKALVVVDQYGDVVDNANLGDYSIATSDSGVISSTGNVIGEGKATITVSINKQFFVVNVNVK